MLLAGPRLNWGHQPAPERDTSIPQGQAAWPDPLHGRGFWCTGGGSGAREGVLGRALDVSGPRAPSRALVAMLPCAGTTVPTCFLSTTDSPQACT